MKNYQRCVQIILIVLLISISVLMGRQIYAQENHEITLVNNDSVTREAVYGDTVWLTMNYSEDDVRNADEGEINDLESEMVDEWGNPVAAPQQYQPSASFSYDYFGCTRDELEEGKFTLNQYGEATIEVTGYTGYQNEFFHASVIIQVGINMDQVSMKKTSLEGTIVTTKNSYYFDTKASFTVPIESDYVFDEFDGLTTLNVTSSNKKMDFSAWLSSNQLTLETYDYGKTKLTIELNGKKFTLSVTVHQIKLGKNSYLMAKGKKENIRIKTDLGNISWKSTNPKVAMVRKNVIYGRSEGNAILKAKYKGQTLAILVSVTTAQKLSAIKYAKYTAAHSTYSQDYRMQKGYYDCSSLVWRAYHQAGVNLVSSGYAPTAADIGKWLVQKGRRIKGGYSEKNMSKLNLLPGDLYFQSGEANGRFMNIYHVEMFAGYEFYGLDQNGKPMVSSKWANRPDGYYWTDGDMICRP